MTNTEFAQNHYHEALAALVNLAPSLPVIQALRRGPNPYNTEKVAYLLDKHNYTYQAPEPKAILSEPSAAATEPSYADQIPMELSEELIHIREERKNLFKEASFLHANKLEDASLSPEERKAASFRILNIHDNLIPALDAEEKYILEHKKLPLRISTDAPAEPAPKETPAPALIDSTDKLAIYKRIQTLKKNIGRDKRKFPERAEKYQAEINLLQPKYDSM